MTVAMSDLDYAVLVEAAFWVKLHSGADAPEYSRLDALCWVVDGIARRRPVRFDALRVTERRDPCSDLGVRVFDLRDRLSSRPTA